MRDNLPEDAVVLATPEISTAIYPIGHRFVANYAFSPNQDLERVMNHPCSYSVTVSQHGITHVYSPPMVCEGISLLEHNTYQYT